MIRPGSEPDWFVISLDQALRLGAAVVEDFGLPKRLGFPLGQCSPGVREVRVNGSIRLEAHRSQLPLLGEAVANAASAPHEQRDAFTNPLGFKLRPHQQVAVDFIEPRRGVLLADEPRVGKSLSAIMSHDPSRGPLLVVCPLIVREVWKTWLGRRFPGEEIGILEGKTFDPSVYNRNVVVGHYDILSRWQSGRRIGTLVLDEAHVLSKSRSQRTTAAAFLAARAEKVICLTGTPLWNKPIGLFQILSILAPAGWGAYHEFGHRYCAPLPTAHGTKYDGASNEDELMLRLSEVMLRRRWVDVQGDLPPTTREVITAELSAAKRLEVDIAAEMLRKASTHAATIGAIARYRQVLGDVKATVAVARARELLALGEPVVVWTWHRNTAKNIRRDLSREFPAFVVSGDMAPERREALFAAWREAAKPAALVITIPAGQVGIDLSHARYAIFAELDFTPALVAQAQMRTFSPLRPMTIIYIVADHEVDRRVLTSMSTKMEVSDRIGVPAADAALEVLQDTFGGVSRLADGDLSRLADDLLASAYEVD